MIIIRSFGLRLPSRTPPKQIALVRYIGRAATEIQSRGDPPFSKLYMGQSDICGKSGHLSWVISDLRSPVDLVTAPSMMDMIDSDTDQFTFNS